ncbi:hypothetical protein MCAMS1_00599 [biofilm metagenome]
MNSEDMPVQSAQSLINACLIACILALVVLFTAVLPAEYGIDPTGLGQKMGLTALAESVQANALNCPPAQQSAATVMPQTTAATTASSDLNTLDESQPITWQDEVTIEIPPQKGLEYKFKMAQGAVLEFTWAADNSTVMYYDFHGEPEGATDGYFKSYQEKKDSTAKGKLIAPFAGIHGWYWENATDKPVKIQLKSKGVYEVLGVMGG